MRQNNNRRQRGRNNNRRNQPNRNQVFDSNGPNVRVRGNAQQIMDKYMALARDAQSAGNHVLAEAFFQHGEHYLRIHLVNQAAVEEAKARKEKQREERQAKSAGDNNADEQAATADEGEATVESAEDIAKQLDPSEQEQPSLAAAVEGELPEAVETIELIPSGSDDEQPVIS